MAIKIPSFFKYVRHRAITLVIAAVSLCAAISLLHDPLQSQNPPVGAGLYEKQCAIETFERYGERFDFATFTMVPDTVEYDSLVCRLVPITTLYPDLMACDTVTTLLRTQIDTIYVDRFIVLDETNPDGYYEQDELYDTLLYYSHEVRCRRIDTLYTYDTIIRDYRIVFYDTARSSDTLRVTGPSHHTDTTFTYCPHITNPYNPYAGFAEAIIDSIQNLERQLATLQAQWQAQYGDKLRDAIDYDAIAAARVAKEYEACNTCFTPLPIIPGDTLAIRLRDSCLNHRATEIHDSLTAIAPHTPAALRARIEAFRALLQDYAATVQRTDEYHIDSVHVIATVYENGLSRTQDFVVRTIPMFYRRQADTTIRSEEPLMLFAGSPFLPDTSGPNPLLSDTTYTTIEWGQPLNAATYAPVNPARGFAPGTLYPAGAATLHEPHASALQRDYGRAGMAMPPGLQAPFATQAADSFPTWAPLYIADTLDGDSLLFPLVIRATNANRSRFPGAPEVLCEHHDTIKVVIKKGFEIRGYVSYAGLWFPSQVGDYTTPDVATVDGDIDAYFLKHEPIGSVTVYLKDPATGAVLDTAVSGDDGYFKMKKNWTEGRYVVTGRSPQKTHVIGLVGLNGNDATWIQNYTINKLPTTTLPENTNPELSMWWWAANVDLTTTPKSTKGLDGNDATDIQNKTIGKLNTPTNKYKEAMTGEWLDDWVYSTDTVYFTSDTNFHVRGVMRGDADRNYDGTEPTSAGNPSQMRKSARNKLPKLDIAQVGSLNVTNDIRMLDFPVISEDSGWLKGFQMFLYYNADKVEPIGVILPQDLNDARTNLEYNVIDDQILTTWVSKTPRYFYPGDTLLMLNLKLLKKPVKNLSNFFKNNPLQYVVSDTLARIVPEWRVSMPALDIYYPEDDEERGPMWSVEFGDTIYQVSDEETPLVAQGKTLHDYSHILAVIPNPIITWGDVTYYVSQSSLVNLKLYSMMGECVATFVEGERQFGHYRLSMNIQHLPSGIYILRLETTVHSRTEFDVVKIVIKR